RIEDEAAGLFCPDVADVFVGGEAFQDFEPTRVVVGGDEVCQMASELLVAVVGVAINCRFLEGSVHPLDLAIRPRVVGVGQAMLNAVSSADLLETVDPGSCRPAMVLLYWRGELDAVVGADRMPPGR